MMEGEMGKEDMQLLRSQAVQTLLALCTSLINFYIMYGRVYCIPLSVKN